MLVAKGLGRCFSLLYSCTLLYETTSTPTAASPNLELPQYPLPTYTAALANNPTLVFNKSHGTTLPSAITNLTSNEWPDPPFSARIPGFTDVLNFLATRREGTFLQKVVLENLVQAQLIQWSREQNIRSRPLDFIRVGSNVRFRMRVAIPRVGGSWLSYELAIAALNEFRNLVSQWGAIEIPNFLIDDDTEVKAILEVKFLNAD